MRHPRTTATGLALLTAFAACAAQAQPATSTYTPLAGRGCQSRALHADDPVDGGGRRCRGVGGYSLRIETGDDRDFVTLIPPRGRGTELRLSEIVTAGFSSVGDRAEWRLRGRTPHALIFRLNHQDPTTESERRPLVVVSLARACLTAVIPAGPRQNERAREAADRPGPCLQPLSA